MKLRYVLFTVIAAVLAVVLMGFLTRIPDNSQRKIKPRYQTINTF